MNSVLITGGTGCVGSNLAVALIPRCRRVRIFHRASSDLRTIVDLNVEHSLGDIRDPASVAKAVEGCDTVFHTAALVSHSKARRDEVQQTNVIGTHNVIDACLKHGVRRLVHVSSVAAIGYPSDGGLADERTAFNWTGPPGYKLSKRKAELEVESGVSQGLEAVIVNPSVIIGERDIHFHGGELIRSARRGALFFYLDGGMNVVYVGDVVRGMIQAAEKGRSGERYLLCGENLSHKEIFARTAKLVGGVRPTVKLPISLLHAGARTIESACNLFGIDPWVTDDLVANAGKFVWFNCAKAKEELDYTVTPFDETIMAAYRWYRDHGLL